MAKKMEINQLVDDIEKANGLIIEVKAERDGAIDKLRTAKTEIET